jgi:hypothetical protein
MMQEKMVSTVAYSINMDTPAKMQNEFNPTREVNDPK